MAPLVIAGAGLAGYTVAREFRKLDATSPVVVVAADAADFYAKPKLSNAFADGKAPGELVTTPAAAMAQQLRIDVRAGTRIDRIDAAARRLETAAGPLEYSRLVLALGADPIRLPLGGDGAGDVLSVNDLADYATFRAALAGKSRVVILGAGLIGCEFANDLAGSGVAVTVVDPAGQPLASLAPEGVGGLLEAALEAAGVAWRFERTASIVDRDGDGYRVTLDDGSTIGADVVLSAVGLRPRTALARNAGLAVDRGIVVDGELRTSAPDVYAIGDCAEIEGVVRPYVMPIMHAARSLVRSLALAPTPVAFPAMPIVVKTPACPVVVQPAPRDAAGAWRGEPNADGLRMRFLAPDGGLLGFALAGRGAVPERAALARQLAPEAFGRSRT